MRKYRELFDLIKSMTGSEKRSFKMNTRLHTKQGKNNYILLFNAIEQQKTPNEERIKKKFAGSLLGQNLSSVKYQLYNQILQNLRAHAKKGTVENQLRKYLDNIEQMYSRGLLKPAGRLVTKGLEFAKQYELWTEALQFLNWERKLFRVMDKSQLRGLKEIISDLKRMGDNIQRECELQSMVDELEGIKAEARGFKAEEHVKLLEKTSRHAIVASPDLPTKFNERLNFFKIWSWIAFVKQQDTNEARRYYEKILAWWDQHPDHIALRPAQYATDITEYIRYKIRTERVGNVLHLLEKLDQMAFKLEYDRVNTICRRYNIELILAMNFPYGKDRIALMETIQKWLKKNAKMIENRWLVSFNYNFTTIYFTEAKFSKAAKHLRELRNQVTLVNRPDMHDYGRIMQIILQFEQEEYDHVNYLLRSAYRYLRRQETMVQFEEMLLDYLRKYIKKSHSKGATALLKALLQKLDDSFDPSAGPFPLGTYEVSFWLESKIKKVPLPKLMQLKLAGRPKVD